ncbi:ATP-dependent DNA helicase RecG [Fluviibacterium sp. S390]|uniref:ATP-dependent DNA helicase RecG n=1 Tax=Fluviibacterium sp. S390 TaxID=3415139 RepID=UPI003C799326
MSGRPQALFPLFAALTTLPGIGPKTAQALEQVQITKPRDLLFTLPTSCVDRRPRASAQGVPQGAVVTVSAKVLAHYPPARKGRPYRVLVEDAQTTITLVWFRPNPRYLQELLPVGEARTISGKLEFFDGQAQIAHPDYVLPEADAAKLPEFEPVYPLTAGITQKTMTKAAQGALALLPEMSEWIDGPLLSSRNWPDFAAALHAAHHPKSGADLAPSAPARTRLAYDELFAHQLTLALARAHARKQAGRENRATGQLQDRVLASLPYAPTGAQTRAIAEIQSDMAAPHRMNRLLQGDVGAGKTLVALMALLAAVEAGGQGVMMAPTEILARQHAAGLAPLVAAAGVRMEVLTGRDTGTARATKLAALAEGKIQILCGTHAVFQPDVGFADLRLVVIDEQHRFGVRQRLELTRKGLRPDVLVMTATPIPRSLALTQYGDMDLSILNEKPPGRTPIKTALMAAEKLDSVVDHLRQAITEGRQAYWVCPLVEESETHHATAAEERFKALRARLGDGNVGLVHGQMPPERKDAAMADFIAGTTRVLVATTAIEVGVDVPNASIMVIEGAEHFGLAQLHQLRGRVGRGTEKSTCLLLYDTPLTDSARRRLTLLRDSEDGFRLAEEDLAMRGAGDMIGVAQSGLPRFRVADLDSQSGLMETARDDARALLAIDSTLSSPRGAAARHLLWLLEQDQALALLRAG